MHRFEIALENDRWLNIVEAMVFFGQHRDSDIIIDAINEGHCLTHCGVYHVLDTLHFSSVRVNTANALETHQRYKINNASWKHWLQDIHTFEFDYDHTWTGQKIFGCFFGRPSAPRLGIAGHLLRYHRDQALVMTKFDFSQEDTRKNFDLERLFQWDESALDNLFLLKDLLYQFDTEYVRGRYDQSNPLSRYYKNIFVDLVSEPSCAGRAFYPTEKISRAMLCKKPFVVMGNKNYLAYLRQMGFQTFNDFWDEDYDGFDQNLRYKKILQLVDSIAALDQSSIRQLHEQMQPLVEHNFDLLRKQSYHAAIIPIIDEYAIDD